METALQELIAELQIEMQKAQEQDSPNIASGFWHSIVKAQAKLPKEREQMEGEVLNVIKWVEDNFYSNGNDIFTHIETQVQYKRAELYKHYETNFNK